MANPRAPQDQLEQQPTKAGGGKEQKEAAPQKTNEELDDDAEIEEEGNEKPALKTGRGGAAEEGDEDVPEDDGRLLN